MHTCTHAHMHTCTHAHMHIHAPLPHMPPKKTLPRSSALKLTGVCFQHVVEQLVRSIVYRVLVSGVGLLRCVYVEVSLVYDCVHFVESASFLQRPSLPQKSFVLKARHVLFYVCVCVCVCVCACIRLCLGFCGKPDARRGEGWLDIRA